MMLAGDELSNSRDSNNNTYCQDNEISWVNWPEEDDPFFTVCQQAIAFPKMHPFLRQTRFLHSRQRLIDGEPDLFWWRADGAAMQQKDWETPDLNTLVAEMRMASGSLEYIKCEGTLLVVLNRGHAIEITPPELADGGGFGFDALTPAKRMQSKSCPKCRSMWTLWLYFSMKTPVSNARR